VRPLPPIPHPKQYEGLFVYDFGSHVSVGYTAAEIGVLRRSPLFREGSAYQIYRVDQSGGLELRGVQDAVLETKDCLCFLRQESGEGRRDYDRLIIAAQARPLPVPVEARLVRSYGFEPPNLTALIFPAWATVMVSGWLGGLEWAPGDMAAAGSDAFRALHSSGGLTIATSTLAHSGRFSDRTPQEVLASTGLSLQR